MRYKKEHAQYKTEPFSVTQASQHIKRKLVLTQDKKLQISNIVLYKAVCTAGSSLHELSSPSLTYTHIIYTALEGEKKQQAKNVHIYNKYTLYKTCIANYRERCELETMIN